MLYIFIKLKKKLKDLFTDFNTLTAEGFSKGSSVGRVTHHTHQKTSLNSIASTYSKLPWHDAHVALSSVNVLKKQASSK